MKMRRIVVTAFTILFLSACGESDPEATDIGGTWEGTTTDPRALDWTLAITDKGGSLGGTVTIKDPVSGQGSAGSITGGSYEHPVVEMTMQITYFEHVWNVTYTGAVRYPRESMLGGVRIEQEGVVIGAFVLELNRSD